MRNRVSGLLALGVCVALTACSDATAPAIAGLTISGPASLTPSANAPLAFRVTITTSLNANLTAEVDDGQGHAFTVLYNRPRVSNPRNRVTHDLNLLGLRPNRTYTVDVTANTVDGLSASLGTLQAVTAALPADFPVITVNTVDSARMEVGFTLLDSRRKDGSASYIVILDDAGEIVWYAPRAGNSKTVRLGNGRLLTIDEVNGLIQEIDNLGEPVVAFHSAQSHPAVGDSTAVDVSEFHGGVHFSPFTLSYFTSVATVTQVADFPLDENDQNITGAASVRDEPIVEFNAEGTIISTWSLLDLLKSTRIGYDGTLGLPASPADWAHVNEVEFDPGANAILASLRHQDAVVKIDRVSGDLLWILGPPANWQGFEQFLLTPDGGPFAWAYHQHGVEVTSTGAILLFDNGNRRASPFTGEVIVTADANESRAVEYTVDEATMMISQIWEWGMVQSGEALYSPIAGDVDRLPTTGNRLITYGALCAEAGVPSDNLDVCRTTARVVEVEDENDERVFDIGLDDADPMSTGYVVWQSERLSGLYTGENANVLFPEQ